MREWIDTLAWVATVAMVLLLAPIVARCVNNTVTGAEMERHTTEAEKAIDYLSGVYATSEVTLQETVPDTNTAFPIRVWHAQAGETPCWVTTTVLTRNYSENLLLGDVRTQHAGVILRMYGMDGLLKMREDAK